MGPNFVLGWNIRLDYHELAPGLSQQLFFSPQWAFVNTTTNTTSNTTSNTTNATTPIAQPQWINFACINNIGANGLNTWVVQQFNGTKDINNLASRVIGDTWSNTTNTTLDPSISWLNFNMTNQSDIQSGFLSSSCQGLRNLGLKSALKMIRYNDTI